MKAFFRALLVIAMTLLLVGVDVDADTFEDTDGTQTSPALPGAIVARINPLSEHSKVQFRDLFQRSELVFFFPSADGCVRSLIANVTFRDYSLQSLCLLRC